MTSSIRSFRQTLGMAAIASLALGGSWAPARAANQAGSSIMMMEQDLANREKDIHWAEGFDPSQADLFSHNALLINASCERIWGHIVDATKWPQWYPNSKDVHIDGGDVLKGGTVFHWSTFGLPLESKVNEFVPYSCQRRFADSLLTTRIVFCWGAPWPEMPGERRTFSSCCSAPRMATGSADYARRT
jgi:hypothetical protein